MKPRVASASEATFVRLCRTAEDRAETLGHHLGPWSVEDEAGRRAACTECGRAVYARVEGNLAGIAGRACSERCGD